MIQNEPTHLKYQTVDYMNSMYTQSINTLDLPLESKLGRGTRPPPSMTVSAEALIASELLQLKLFSLFENFSWFQSDDRFQDGGQVQAKAQVKARKPSELISLDNAFLLFRRIQILCHYLVIGQPLYIVAQFLGTLRIDF